MKPSEIFYGELQLIQDERLRVAVTNFLDTQVPDYFFIIAASSTGKYHPWYSLGYGGLVRHTKAAVKIAYDLLQLEQNQSLPADEILSALIIHDTFKLGVPAGQYTVAEHPLIAANAWAQFAPTELHDQATTVAQLISTHMGQWNTIQGKAILPKPSTDAQKFVHTCDYLASRKYITVEVQ